MIHKDFAEKLKWLAEIDLDVVESYRQALPEINEKEIRNRLSEFRDDHLQHFQDISDFIYEFGGTQPIMPKQHFNTPEFLAVEKGGGSVAALRILLNNERVALFAYEDAMSWTVTNAELALLIEDYCDDEQIHFEIIEDLLNSQERKAA